MARHWIKAGETFFMKAMVLRGPNLPFGMTTTPDPVAGPGETVARVITCGAGLPIQHVKAGRRQATFPRIIGHEITGEIVAVGAGVSGLKVGDGLTASMSWCLADHVFGRLIAAVIGSKNPRHGW
jgi:D-arabinose 1-dehydrogenase-like Zn-dependent alcohol dehydrogenase